jgi:hypothetical protein
MPGSPPSSTTEPLTTPPSTRSNSAMPVRRRTSVSPLTSLSRMGFAAPPEAPQAGRFSSTFASVSSSSELQAPQSGHFPSHFAVWYPHAWQV